MLFSFLFMKIIGDGPVMPFVRRPSFSEGDHDSARLSLMRRSSFSEEDDFDKEKSPPAVVVKKVINSNNEGGKVIGVGNFLHLIWES